MCLLVVATVTADCRPIAGPLDGIFYRGAFHFGTAPDSVRYRHLLARPQVSATHLPREEFAVNVHGRAVPVDVAGGFRETLLEVYVPALRRGLGEVPRQRSGVHADRRRPDVHVPDGVTTAGHGRPAERPQGRRAKRGPKSTDGVRHRSPGGPPAEQAAAEERTLERAVAVHAAATEARDLAGGVQTGQRLATGLQHPGR